jgi:hypothetical protein
LSIPGSTLAVTALQAGGVILLQSLQSANARNIGGLVAHVTVEEHHEDDLVITEHPVEQGAAITDHAYKRPAMVRIRAGWSNSPVPLNTGLASIPLNVLGSLAQTAAAFAGPAEYVKDVYERLIKLQASLQPFTIVTGKRIYSDMLFQSLMVTTDEKTENVLMVMAVCKQIIRVQTTLIINASRINMVDPATNAPDEPQGTLSLNPPTTIDLGTPVFIPPQ